MERSLQERAQVLRLAQARKRQQQIARSRVPWATVGPRPTVVVAEGTVAFLDAEGQTAVDLLASEPEPRKAEGFMHRASVRIRAQGSDDFGPVNAPRRNGDGFMEYKVHQRVRMVDGYKAIGIRSDAWARARRPEVGYARLARLKMDRAYVPMPVPLKGLGNGPEQSTLAHGRSSSAQARWIRNAVGRVLTDAELYVKCTTTYNGKAYRFEVHRETGEVRRFGPA